MYHTLGHINVYIVYKYQVMIVYSYLMLYCIIHSVISMSWTYGSFLTH